MVTGHNFESWPPKDHSCHVCFKLTYWFQRRRLLTFFSIGSYVKFKSSVLWPWPPSKMANISKHIFNIGPYGKNVLKKISSEISKPMDHSCHVCFKLTYWFQRRRLLTFFSIGSYVKFKSSHGGHLEFPISKRFTILVQDHPMIIPAKPQFSRNVHWMVIYKIVFLVLIGNPTWLPGPIMCSDWSKFFKSSC
jgi:hypothetical protein